MRIRELTIGEVEYMAFELARELMTWDEPIPDFGTRYPRILESCIATPFQTFSKLPLYRKLTGKGAILFYLMIKNHPFKNGNKRIAVMTLLAFLYLNHKWLRISNVQLYNFAVAIAKSHPRLKAEYVRHVENFISKNMIPS